MKGEDLKRIADQTRRQQFDKGEVIIKEGAHGSKLFIIISGRAEAIKNLGGKARGFWDFWSHVPTSEKWL